MALSSAVIDRDVGMEALCVLHDGAVPGGLVWRGARTLLAERTDQGTSQL